MPEILEIRMQSFETVCSQCGRPNDDNCGLPTVNGDLVSNEFPDAVWSEHGGSIPACWSCYCAHNLGTIPTFDRYYLWLGMTQCDGSVI